jgi:hypothetical protein
MPAAAHIRHLRRGLIERLERLRETLEELIERVHESVAQAVSQAVSAAVREVILVVLRAAMDQPSLPATPRWPPARHHAAWQERRDPHYGDSECTDPAAAWWTDDEPADDAAEGPPPSGVEPSPLRWRYAMALGCRAIAWWARRWSGGRPLLAALGVGTACATAAYAVVAGLANETLRWLALAGAIGSGIWALNWASNT